MEDFGVRKTIHFLMLSGVLGLFLAPQAAVADAHAIDFDEIMTTVWTETGIWTVVAGFDVLPEDFSLDPAVSDINGGFDASVTPIVLYPNGMLDSDEFALLSAILADPGFDATATGGTSHTAVHAAWTQNYAQTYVDLGGGVGGIERLLNPGPTPNMIPDIEYLVAAMFTVGDQDTMTFPLLLLDLVVNDETVASIINDPNIRVPNAEDYAPLYPYLGWCGDADGDGCSNLHEYEHFYPIGGRVDYLAAAMDPAVTPPGCSNDAVCDGSGGLFAEYFHEMNLSDRALTRVDQQVSFDWGSGAPHPDLEANTFSVCWTGTVEAQYSEVYTFSVRTDDGVRLWVDGELLVDQWNDHGPTTYSGTMSGPFVVGETYSVRMDFYENGGGAVAWLGWESASQSPKGIYGMYLKPGVGVGDRDSEWIRNPANGHYYRLTDPMTWEEGRDLALSWGGYLVTIDDAEENAWIFTTFGVVGNNFFLGGNDIDAEGTWVWAENSANFWVGASGGAVVAPWYANWNASEPNDHNGAEDAALLYHTSGLWNDLSSASVQRCLVETHTGRITYSGPAPYSATVSEFYHFQFEVEVFHPFGEVTYQWRKDGVDIDGATSAILAFDKVKDEDAGMYACVISDESLAVVETAASELIVIDRGELPAGSAWGLVAATLACILGGLHILRRRRAIRPQSGS